VAALNMLVNFVFPRRWARGEELIPIESPHGIRASYRERIEGHDDRGRSACEPPGADASEVGAVTLAPAE